MNKKIKKMFLLSLILTIIFILCPSKIFARTIDNNIEAIDDNLYPGFKTLIQALQANHPNWTFKVEYTDLLWEEVINGEHQGHSASTSPTNLSPADNSKYSGLWICEICGTQRYDSGNWYCASKEALEYMIDPRNSLNETDLFQFMQLSGFEDFNTETVKNTLNTIKPSWIDDECVDAIIEAANTYHVDPYYILAKLLEEQSATSPLFTGSGYDGNYQGYYNLFNVGATANTKEGVILNGLAHAASQGWTTKRLSILGGVSVLANGYIAEEQDTLYYQKYDVIGDSKYQHQYQQNILGAQNAGTYLKKSCSNDGNYSFIIPLYKNMPESACPRPNVSQSHSQNTASGLMGDINGDNDVNVLDVVMLINYLNGENGVDLDSSRLELAKVSGNSDITVLDVVMLINYLNGEAVLPQAQILTGTVNNSTKLRLSPDGTEFKSVSSGTSIEILKRAVEAINGVYWDLVVASNGSYGYISRNYYQ